MAGLYGDGAYGYGNFGAVYGDPNALTYGSETYGAENYGELHAQVLQSCGFEAQSLADDAEGEGFRTVGTPTIDTGTVRTGAASLKVAAATSYVEWIGVGGTLDRHYYLRAYIQKSANPTTTTSLLAFNAADVSAIGRIAFTTAGQPRLFNAAGTNIGTGTALSSGAWHLIELHAMVPTSGNGLLEMRINGVSTVLNTSTNTGNAGIGYAIVGQGLATVPGANIFFDDVLFQSGLVLDLTDSVTPSESTGGDVEHPLSDTATTSDAVSSEPNVGPTDTATVSDSAVKDVSQAAADTATISESAPKDVTHPLTDTATVTDAASSEPNVGRTDSVSVSDALTDEEDLVLGDSVTVSDSQAKDAAHVVALSVADDFNRANENPLSNGGKWLSWSGFEDQDLQVVSNRAKAVAALGYSGNRWTDTFTDCEVEATLAVVPTNEASLYARIGVDDRSYLLTISNDADTVGLYYYDGVDYNELDLASYTAAANDRFRLRVVGSQLTAYANGVEVLSATDSNLTSGRVAIDGTELTEWEDFTASALEAVAVTDSFGIEPNVGQADSVTPSDVRVADVVVGLTDSVTTSDAFTDEEDLVLGDSVTTSDSSVSEVQTSLTDAATVSEAASLGPQVFPTDAVTASDSEVADVRVALGETLTTSDDQESEVVVGPLELSLDDSLTISDALVTEDAAVLGDSVTVTDGFVLTEDVSDSVAVSDTVILMVSSATGAPAPTPAQGGGFPVFQTRTVTVESHRLHFSDSVFVTDDISTDRRISDTQRKKELALALA